MKRFLLLLILIPLLMGQGGNVVTSSTQSTVKIDRGALQLPIVSNPPANVSYGQINTNSNEHLVFTPPTKDPYIVQPGGVAWTMIPLRSVVDNQVNLFGEFREVTNTETGDYATDFEVCNNHIYIYVDTITTGGNIVITGASIDETSGISTASDTETITVDTTATQYYQSTKKWWEVTNIDISSGTIANIDYDIGVVGYVDVLNHNFKIKGYRVDAFSQGVSPDFEFRIIKINDNGSKKMSIDYLEKIGVDANGGTDQIIDNLRTGGDDRGYNPDVGSIWGDNQTLVFKQGDFDTYFTGNENEILAGDGDEGVIIKIIGSPSAGISNVDWISIQMYWGLI